MRRTEGQWNSSLEAIKAGLPAVLSVILTGRTIHHAELKHGLDSELAYETGVVYSTYPCFIDSASLLADVSPYESCSAVSSCSSRSGSLIRAFMEFSPLRFREGNHRGVLSHLSLLLNPLLLISSHMEEGGIDG